MSRLLLASFLCLAWLPAHQPRFAAASPESASPQTLWSVLVGRSIESGQSDETALPAPEPVAEWVASERAGWTPQPRGTRPSGANAQPPLNASDRRQLTPRAENALRAASSQISLWTVRSRGYRATGPPVTARAPSPDSLAVTA